MLGDEHDDEARINERGKSLLCNDIMRSLLLSHFVDMYTVQ